MASVKAVSKYKLGDSFFNKTSGALSQITDIKSAQGTNSVIAMYKLGTNKKWLTEKKLDEMFRIEVK